MAEPVRIQLSRAKGWRMPENTVKVDRSTKWGNPFSAQAAIDYGFANKETASAFVVRCFREWITPGPHADRMWMGPQSDAARQPFRDLSSLRGKNLGCWCKLCDEHKAGKPFGVRCEKCAPCHSDPLGELANTPPDEPHPTPQEAT